MQSSWTTFKRRAVEQGIAKQDFPTQEVRERVIPPEVVLMVVRGGLPPPVVRVIVVAPIFDRVETLVLPPLPVRMVVVTRGPLIFLGI